jgi:hypothetical protein
MQMGVKYDRILDASTGPFEKINGLLPPPPSTGHRDRPARRLPDQPPDQQFLHRDQPPAEGRRDVYWIKQEQR